MEFEVKGVGSRFESLGVKGSGLKGRECAPSQAGLAPRPTLPHATHLCREKELRVRSQSDNNYFTEMCSGSEAGSYLRLIDFMCHSTLGLRVIKREESEGRKLGFGVYG